MSAAMRADLIEIHLIMERWTPLNCMLYRHTHMQDLLSEVSWGYFAIQEMIK